MNQRIRREPPRFRRLTVQAVAPVTPRLVSVTLGGDELEGFLLDAPAASARLLLSDEMPEWTGNEFLLRDGSRPVIRTLTPLRLDAAARTVDVEIVLHGGGAVSTWAANVSVGDVVALAGPGRGYLFDENARSFVLAGDETALPAMRQLVGALASNASVAVHVEIAQADARVQGFDAAWHELAEGAAPGDALVHAVTSAELPADARIWVAGEAAAVQRIRKHLFEERGFTRSQATVRGYWKHGRAGGGDED